LDCCNAILAGSPKSTCTDKLQRVLNAAVRVVSDTRKYDRGLSRLLHDELHWLDVPQPVQYKLRGTVHRYLQHNALQCMMDRCSVHLRHCSSAASAVRRLPSAVRTATSAFDVRSSRLFSGWPGGLELVTKLPTRSVTFLRHLAIRRDLKTFLFSFH